MSNGIKNDTIEEIKSRCNIVDVIGRFVLLKKTGSNYKGLCPFHNEKTPSFVVSEEKQIFTCFGCGATGDVIEFVKRYNNLDFQEAILKLAEEYGIEIKKESFTRDGIKKELYEINREVATYFYRAFKVNGNPAYEYMKNRGIDDDTLREFGIGYADSSWSNLYDHLKGKGISPKKLLELGLISQSKGKYYDRFRERVIFPIINTQGLIVGFGGRALSEENNPKYLNSPETPVFQKKNNLYGLNLTRQNMSKENSAILVEGYMDVISLYQLGIKNVTASLGTALTENQASMLRRYTENIVVAYDIDEAGQAAALRGIDILHKAKCKAKVLRITEGKDPDEFIKKRGKKEFLDLINKALPFADYKITRLREKYDISTTEGSVEFLQEVAKVLSYLSPIEADVYIKKIAHETKISEKAIKLEINGNHNNDVKPTYKDPQNKAYISFDSEIGMIEKNFIKLMLVKSSFINRIKPYKDVFKSEAGVNIYAGILASYDSNEEIDIRKLEDGLEEKDRNSLRKIMENVQLSNKEEEIFNECVEAFERRKNMRREKEIIDILSILDDEPDKDQYDAQGLLKELTAVQKAIRPKR